MNLIKNIFIKSVVLCSATLFFYSCENDTNEIEKLMRVSQEPVGITYCIDLIHTDASRMKAHLMSDKRLDYSNKEFAYSEFPEGLLLHFYDENNQKSTVVADYGIIYDESDLVDLRGNVKLTSHDGTRVEARQLYWDQKNEWLFTNEPYTIFFENGGYNKGDEFDAKQDFTIFTSRNNEGVVLTK